MRYLFKTTYNPNRADLDKDRRAFIIESEAGVLDAITGAVSKLGIEFIHDDVIRDYLEAIGSEDTTDGWEWNVYVRGVKGVWTFEWRPFEVSDPVTKEAIKIWAMVQNDTSEEEAWVSVLIGVLGRWHWRKLESLDVETMQMALHDMVMDGCEIKGFNNMTGDEVLEAVMEGPVEFTCFDEVAKGKPFGMAAMVESDRELWLGECSAIFTQRSGVNSPISRVNDRLPAATPGH
jgi:hypothetical protein